MSEENNLGDSKQKETSEKSFQKGWNNLIDGFKGGFEKFQQSLEDQSKKNKELWEVNKDKVNKFFTDIKQDWDNKLKRWNEDMEKKRLESKEQWDAYKNKVSQDFKNFQEKAKQDGMMVLRGSYSFINFFFIWDFAIKSVSHFP